MLPCCFFNFNGKYQRRQSGKTQYREYLDFVHEVGAACGFCVEEDSLRIPSTKRVCVLPDSTCPAPASPGVPQHLLRCPTTCPGISWLSVDGVCLRAWAYTGGTRVSTECVYPVILPTQHQRCLGQLSLYPALNSFSGERDQQAQ